MSACAKDRSLCGFPSLLSQFFWGCHLQSRSPWSLESWKIPEVTGTPLLKSQSGARTPFPAARWCRCGCPPAWATGSRKNQGVPAQERGVKARPPHTQPLADWWLPWALGSAVLLLAGNYLSQLCRKGTKHKDYNSLGDSAFYSFSSRMSYGDTLTSRSSRLYQIQ